MTGVTKGELKSLQEGLGGITWWGFSPVEGALSDPMEPDDEEEDDDDEEDEEEEDEPWNILLLGSGDGRHLIHHLVRRSPDVPSERQVHFYIWEQNLALYARQILFLAILKHVEPTERVKIFMDTFGNLMVTPQTIQAIRSLSTRLEQLLRDPESDPDYLPGTDFSKLKAQERDEIADHFKRWQGESPTPSEGELESEHWDVRNRRLFQDRFGSREGVIEMDYRLRLVERGGSIISLAEYSSWRLHGNAFIFESEEESGEDDDQAQEVETQPNPTLISTLMVTDPESGGKVPKEGFWGDIVTGPFISFGFVPADPSTTSVDLAETQLRRTATQNVFEYFQAQMTAEESIPIEVTFLSIPRGERDLVLREKYHDTFDSIFVGCSVADFVSKNMLLNLNESSPSEMVIESPLYLLHLDEEVHVRFLEQMRGILNEECMRDFEVDQSEDGIPTAIIRVKVEP
eukprot:maker-scaffold109_size355148-snap-gene-0.16 protein:Tk11024 transcript:maker-scaffold109_size355148-snap-gene-0.16-mRNA-1 annotation:"dynein assembly factor axonemal-like"